LPDRQACRAGDDQLHFARQIQERDHGSEQNREGQRLFGDRRRSQKRQARHENSGCTLRIARATEEFYEIDGVNENEDHHESGNHRAGESASEIE
jgi:hypothetical protein